MSTSLDGCVWLDDRSSVSTLESLPSPQARKPSSESSEKAASVVEKAANVSEKAATVAEKAKATLEWIGSRREDLQKRRQQGVPLFTKNMLMPQPRLKRSEISPFKWDGGRRKDLRSKNQPRNFVDESFVFYTVHSAAECSSPPAVRSTKRLKPPISGFSNEGTEATVPIHAFDHIARALPSPRKLFTSLSPLQKQAAQPRSFGSSTRQPTERRRESNEPDSLDGRIIEVPAAKQRANNTPPPPPRKVRSDFDMSFDHDIELLSLHCEDSTESNVARASKPRGKTLILPSTLGNALSTWITTLSDSMKQAKESRSDLRVFDFEDVSDDTSKEMGSSSSSHTSPMSCTEGSSEEALSRSDTNSDGTFNKVSSCTGLENGFLSEIEESHPPAFASDDEFKSYFSGKTDAMRHLLCLYTTSTEELERSHGPLFHRPHKGVVDADIPSHFFDTFNFTHFVNRNGLITPSERSNSSPRRLSELIPPILDKEMDKYLKAKGRYDGYRHRLKAALQLQRKLDAEANMPQRHKALNYVVKHVQKKFRDFTADGGKTNGEFQPQSVRAVLEKMETWGVSSSDLIVDCGCGYGFMNWVFSAWFGCPTYGIEVECERSRIAAEAYNDIVNDVGSAVLTNKRVGHFNADLNLVDGFLKETTVSWNFDHVFPCSLALDNYEKQAAVDNLRMIITGKTSYEPKLAEKLTELGFWCADKVQCLMSISSEPKMMCFWIREVPEPAARIDFNAFHLSCSTSAMERTLYEMLLDNERSREAYQHLHQEIVDRQLEAKRRRKYIKNVDVEDGPSVCQRGQYKHCLSHCSKCESYFHHHKARAKRRASAIHGKGLFATEAIPANIFVAEFSGHWTMELPDDHALQNCAVRLTSPDAGCGYLVVDGFTDAEGNGCPPVNHSCGKPNCMVIPWTDSENEDRYSLVTKVNVKRMEEMTIDYGPHCQKRLKGKCGCTFCSYRGNTKILLGCMKYCDLGNRVVQKLVDNRIWKAMDGRDVNRIMEMERQDRSLMAFTTNNDNERARLDRHISGDFRDDKWVATIENFLVNCGHEPEEFFDQVVFDDIWNPPGYNRDSWGTTLYTQHLVDLHRLLKPKGCIIFPFHRDIITNLAEHEKWKDHYNTELITEDNLDTNPLWRATQELDQNEMFGKKPDNEPQCCFSPSTLNGIREVHPEAVVTKLLFANKDNLSQARYVRLLKKVCA